MRTMEGIDGACIDGSLLYCNRGNCSNKDEFLLNVSVEIEDVVTIRDALESLTKVDQIAVFGTKFRGDNNKEEVCKEQQFMIDQAPAIAALHLKRFKVGEPSFIEKIGKHIEFPLELDLKLSTNGSQRSNDRQAHLKFHLYATMAFPTRWHKLDDSKVIEVAEEVAFGFHGYDLELGSSEILSLKRECTMVDYKTVCAEHFRHTFHFGPDKMLLAN
ncbi:hypothetical protein GH714_031460 [Hevea brasiliensis]|uniref:USP domain-containing protein n=1 Tax=Hevea brasiliensis TaxID=3981 RepID=A0A6A6LNK4_HEVBR|nr:hypothetical protein GH714_031460 [Hevea brasiliensis]